MAILNARNVFPNLIISRDFDIVGGSTTQGYNVDTKEWIPHRGIAPLMIIPRVFIQDPVTALSAEYSGSINMKLGSIKWFENDVEILGSNTDYTILRSATDADNGKITVRKNVVAETPLKLSFSATFLDPRNGKTTYVDGEKWLNTILSTDSPLSLDYGYPRGQYLLPVEDMTELQAEAKLMLGPSEEINALYIWDEKTESGYNQITEGSGYPEYGGKILRVPASKILPSRNVRVTADRIVDLQGVTPDASGDKCINLIPRSFWSTDWMALNPAICPDGKSMRDADGEYWKIDQGKLQISSLPSLGSHVGSTWKGDCFFNKVKYKTNTPYTLSVKWKLQATQVDPGLLFIFKYKDGSFSSRLSLEGTLTTLTAQFITSDKEKTIEAIGISCGSGIEKTKIYDLQLLEGAYTNPPFRDAPVDRYDGWNATKELADASLLVSSVSSGNIGSFNPVTKVWNWDGTIDINSACILTRIFAGVGVGTIYRLQGKLNGDISKISRVRIGDGSNEGNASLDPATGTFNSIVKAGSLGIFKIDARINTMGSITIESLSIREVRIPVTTASLLANNFPGGALSNRKLSREYFFLRKYQKYNDWVKWNTGGNFPPSIIMDEATIKLDVSKKTIPSPQNYYSFLWHRIVNGVKEPTPYEYGSRAMLTAGDTVAYEIQEGLDNANWMACGDGVDDYLRNSGNPYYNISDSLSNRILVDFIYQGDAPMNMFLFRSTDLISITLDNGYLRYINKYGTGKMLQVSNFINGNRYLVDIRASVSTISNFTVNGITKTLLDDTYSLPSSQPQTYILTSTGRYSTSKIISAKIFDNDDRLIHHWNFQGSTPAERLKDKVRGLSGITPIDLTPYNIANLNDTDPNTGFFKPL